MTTKSPPCVEQVDYRVYLSGVSQTERMAALKACEGLQHLRRRRVASVKHLGKSTRVRFSTDCDPYVVEDIVRALRKAICPEISKGLLKAFASMNGNGRQQLLLSA